MDCTKEPDECALRLPVAYSQGYAYVGVIHGLQPVATTSGSEAADELAEPAEQPNTVALLSAPLAIAALAALLGPFLGATAFVLLRSV